jgi:hypothetical protein
MKNSTFIAMMATATTIFVVGLIMSFNPNFIVL